ncbi:hypothetical protein [Phyllobacterium sp. 0TCS1.6A]|uniref:hypothetical protein n=1 Tax=Phyllobacterium sp. 0TCS1.6A TaxID=2995637 RepID=UPI002263DB02|nr:hypothetical protein [Phyllobacterium sp. 0TCS1.6A]MCX8296218.1 hypothetical protein [Phyllobacterium sp. 0TCS1.6A]
MKLLFTAKSINALAFRFTPELQTIVLTRGDSFEYCFASRHAARQLTSAAPLAGKGAGTGRPRHL